MYYVIQTYYDWIWQYLFAGSTHLILPHQTELITFQQTLDEYVKSLNKYMLIIEKMYRKKINVKVRHCVIVSFNRSRNFVLNLKFYKLGRSSPKMTCTQIWERVTCDPLPPRRGGLTAEGLEAAQGPQKLWGNGVKSCVLAISWH